MKTRPHILSIAGFDPSGGAGILADCKTFEALKCQGLAACTANTIQTDVDFTDCLWVDYSTIEKQIQTLCNRFSIDVVKVGIIENWTVLQKVVTTLKKINPSVKIVLDPVLSSSTHFNFQTDFDETVFDKVLEDIYLLTPNVNEIKKLYPQKTVEQTIDHIQSKTNLFLKGGHNIEQKGKDFLYSNGGKVYPLNPKVKQAYEKHGSGCVLSSAISAYLALGFPLLKSVFRAKRFTEKYLNSSQYLLGNFRF